MTDTPETFPVMPFALLRHIACSCSGCGFELHAPIDERAGTQDFKRLRCTNQRCTEVGKVYLTPTIQLTPG